MQLRNAKRMQINLGKGKSYFISCLWSFVFMVWGALILVATFVASFWRESDTDGTKSSRRVQNAAKALVLAATGARSLTASSPSSVLLSSDEYLRPMQ